MAANIFLCLVGLGLLSFAADHFVMGAARLAVAFRISPVVIGAVVIGFGTSAPEMLVSGIAAGSDQLDIAVGNIEGSNIANLTLVLGTAAMIGPIAVRSTTVRREAPLSVASVVVFAVLVQNGLTRTEGVVLAALTVVAVGWLLRSSRDDDIELGAEVEEFLHEEEPVLVRFEWTRTLLGLVGTLAGAQAVVAGAEGIAEDLNLTGGFVGLTLVAVGTSLPELVTAVAASRKGETDLILGNLLGSNLFNSLAVGATAAMVGPGPLADSNLTGLAVVVMVGVALAAWWFMRSSHRVDRWEAVALLGAYVTIMPVLS